jgi:hypothetical protein
MIDEMICHKCGAQMRRDESADFVLPKSGALVMGYICDNCGATDQCCTVMIEGTIADVVPALENAMDKVGKGHGVVFEKESSTVDKATWHVSLAE